jgi:biopolymer transport protein ExbD
MAFIPRAKTTPVGFNLTPMIDVTFQLLIFFVCANTWSHVESAEELPLPAPIASARVSGEADQPRVTINLRASGEALVMGKVLMSQDEGCDRLTRLLQTEHRRHAANLEVLIRADRQVPYARTQEVFRACSAAGVRQVRFAVLREK